MRTSCRLFILFAVLSTAACSAATEEDSVSSGNEQNLTETKVFELETYVTGTYSGSKSDAENSLASACNAATAAQRAIAGRQFLDGQCAPNENLASGGFLLGATLKSRFVVEIEEGSAPAKSRTAVVSGDYSGSLSDAYASASKACAAELTRAKTLFGDRLISGGCDAPKNIASGGNLMSATFNAFTLPTAGKSVPIAGNVHGAYTGSFADALASWKKACDAWGAKVAPIAGAHLGAADCGEPKNLASGGYLFGSTTSLEVTSGDAKQDAVSSTGSFVTGAYSGSLDDGLSAEDTACDASIKTAKEILGDRLIGATCGTAKNLASGGYIYGGSVPLVVMPAGDTKIVVDGYAFGAYSGSLADAMQSLDTNATKSLRASVTRIGAARVEGYEVAAPTNAASGGYMFGSATKVLVGVTVAEGGLAPITQDGQVKGEYSGSLADSAASWVDACGKAADKAQADYGDRFVAASCGKPTSSGGVFSSSFTTWILP